MTIPKPSANPEGKPILIPSLWKLYMNLKKSREKSLLQTSLLRQAQDGELVELFAKERK